ncbi:Cysteine protease family C48 [Phytophthora palmivora]|uniref:Cysteine protease family C48 n=1 Tax=Phytophthora palmivora TaxID=4796 RepID=A0A2P4YBY1_9STRA|nr:Cysteine protease family C48 [Phytophthora palmivora]
MENLKEEQVVLLSSSGVHCGIYLLHYMGIMATGVVGLQSKLILGQVETLCIIGFNSPKAERLRTFLRRMIHCDSEA